MDGRVAEAGGARGLGRGTWRLRRFDGDADIDENAPDDNGSLRKVSYRNPAGSPQRQDGTRAPPRILQNLPLQNLSLQSLQPPSTPFAGATFSERRAFAFSAKLLYLWRKGGYRDDGETVAQLSPPLL